MAADGGECFGQASRNLQGTHSRSSSFPCHESEHLDLIANKPGSQRLQLLPAQTSASEGRYHLKKLRTDEQSAARRLASVPCASSTFHGTKLKIFGQLEGQLGFGRNLLFSAAIDLRPGTASTAYQSSNGRSLASAQERPRTAPEAFKSIHAQYKRPRCQHVVSRTNENAPNSA